MDLAPALLSLPTPRQIDGSGRRFGAVAGAIRLSVTLALQWPSLAPHALAALRLGLLCIAAAITTQATRPATADGRSDAPSTAPPLSPHDPLSILRDSFVDQCVELVVGTGFALPVLEWMETLTADGDTDTTSDGAYLGGPRAALMLQRRFLSTLSMAIEPPISLPFAVALGRLVCAVLSGLALHAAPAGELHHGPALTLTLVPQQRERLVACLRVAAATFCPPPAAESKDATDGMPRGTAVQSIYTASAADLTREFRGLVASMDRGGG